MNPTVPNKLMFKLVLGQFLIRTDYMQENGFVAEVSFKDEVWQSLQAWIGHRNNRACTGPGKFWNLKSVPGLSWDFLIFLKNHEKVLEFY